MADITAPVVVNTSGEPVDAEEVCSFLNAVRETGKSNMFGAGPSIEKAYKVKERDARTLLMYWMHTFEA